MRILLAEDERSLSRAVVALLEKNNYSADAVYDGAEALEYHAAENYDAVILDIMMPKMDGLTVLRKLRERGSHVPVLMLTAKSEVEDKVAGLTSAALSVEDIHARAACLTGGSEDEKITNARLEQEYAKQAAALLSVVNSSEKTLNKYL